MSKSTGEDGVFLGLWLRVSFLLSGLHMLYWPRSPELSLSLLEEALSPNPTRYEALINRQLHNDYCVPLVRDVIIAPGRGRELFYPFGFF